MRWAKSATSYIWIWLWSHHLLCKIQQQRHIHIVLLPGCRLVWLIVECFSNRATCCISFGDHGIACCMLDEEGPHDVKKSDKSLSQSQTHNTSVTAGYIAVVPVPHRVAPFFTNGISLLACELSFPNMRCMKITTVKILPIFSNELGFWTAVKDWNFFLPHFHLFRQIKKRV